MQLPTIPLSVYPHKEGLTGWALPNGLIRWASMALLALGWRHWTNNTTAKTPNKAKRATSQIQARPDPHLKQEFVYGTLMQTHTQTCTNEPSHNGTGPKHK